MNEEVTHPNHYARLAIEPDSYIDANNFGFRQGNVIKYVSRFDFKDGLKDLIKARENLDRMIEKEKSKVCNKVIEEQRIEEIKNLIKENESNELYKCKLIVGNFGKLKDGFVYHKLEEFININKDRQYRPFYVGEKIVDMDEYFSGERWIICDYFGAEVTEKSASIYRTKRPLPDNAKA